VKWRVNHKPFIFRREGRPNWYLCDRTSGREIQISLRTPHRTVAEALLRQHRERPLRPAQRLRYKPEHLALVDALPFNHATKQKHLLAMRSEMVLSDQPERFAYVLNGHRQGILTELGRLNHAEDVITVADEICRQRMNLPQAMAFVRKLRGVKFEPPTLGESIARAIRNHCKLYPCTFDYISQILGALSIDYQNKTRTESNEKGRIAA
jgi:hypothetical protein